MQQQSVMTYKELNAYFAHILSVDNFSAHDPSQNGIQVANNGSHIKRVAFAVDACLETIKRASQSDADMLFVHHGLFWGKSLLITETHYERINALLKHNIALYACHLPLDAHPKYGNNYGIAHRLGLHNCVPFGLWNTYEIGVAGVFETAHSLDTIITSLFSDGKKPLHVLPFGKKDIHSVAIVSGGGESEIDEAIKKGYDVFITGEISHQTYHEALENGISVIAGGHYQTETVGINLVAEKLAKDTSINTIFIDIPTGL